MQNLSDVVQKVISDFIESSVLFTALDVSNKVKETLPFARHREIRDLVRAVFHSEIESSGYARTPINVTLADGSVVEALLYHPLEDSWDLNTAYDAQKRTQTTSKPIAVAKTSALSLLPQPTTPVVVVPAVPVVVVPAVPVVLDPPAAKDVWEELFKSKPSLFSK